MPNQSAFRIAAALGLSALSTYGLAGPKPFSTARSIAMAGTGVAIAQPAQANFSNPAMLAADHHEWSDDFGLILPSFNASVADEEEVVDQIDEIQQTIDRFNSINPDTNLSDAQNTAGELRDRLNAFNRDTVRLDAGAGLSVAFPGQTLAVGVFASGSFRGTARGDFAAEDDEFLKTLENSTPKQLADADLDQELLSQGEVLASAVAEVGISFAHALDLDNGQRIQLGIAPKYVQLRTFQYTQPVSGFDEDEFDSNASETEKSGLNFDLGASYAFGSDDQWNLGAAIRNVIPMELDSAAERPELGETVRTFELGPQATVGIAHSGDFHVVTAEVDLTENQAFGFEDDTQWLALGAEFDAFRYAQLRLGLRHNLANNTNNTGIEEDTQLSFGLGLSPFGARLDFAGLVSDADTGAAIELGAAF